MDTGDGVTRFELQVARSGRLLRVFDVFVDLRSLPPLLLDGLLYVE
jgi:hypothetical protein